jgi:hypothetical protein
MVAFKRKCGSLSKRAVGPKARLWMNTPAHLLLGAAAFGDPDRRWTTSAALLGALAPDLSLYLMAGFSLVILQIPPQVVFDELYFSDAWQSVFAVDNSFVLWGAAIVLAMWRGRPWMVAFCGAALVHLLTDFGLHNGDARPHFWPISDWRFISPFSYWESGHGAQIIAPLEGILCLILLAILWQRYRAIAYRLMFIVLVVLEAFVIRSWLLLF